ncbi:DNA polymerase III epsilon subunit domain protein [Mycobacterium xenopi 3993]|nr:DNA polymerase III epsilon subunit domain protein [Mycobacterium xenopi 3993]
MANSLRRAALPAGAADAGRRGHPAGAQAIVPTAAPLGGALVEETALIARWLAAPGVRVVCCHGADDAAAGLAAAVGRPWAAWAAAAARRGRRPNRP